MVRHDVLRRSLENSESKYYLSKFRVHDHTLHFFPRYLSNCPVLLLYDERHFSTTQACRIRTISVVVLISDHFITFIKSSRLWSTGMTFAKQTTEGSSVTSSIHASLVEVCTPAHSLGCKDTYVIIANSINGEMTIEKVVAVPRPRCDRLSPLLRILFW
jgi:hypothetical protein